MEYSKTMKVWDEVLKEVCHCYADSAGNRPCDYGEYCDKCSADWVQNIYKNKVKDLMANQKPEKTYKITLELTRVYDVTAESEEEAVNIALDYWDYCVPRIAVQKIEEV